MTNPNHSPETKQAPPNMQKRSSMVWLMPIISIVVVLCFIFYVTNNWNQWEGSKKVQSTTNATVKADITLIKTKVSGYVKDIYVDDFQYVKKGDLLLEIQSDDYQITVNEAQAKVLSAKTTLNNLAIEEKLQEASINQAKANIDSTTARLNLAKLEYQRYLELHKTNAISNHELDTALSNLNAYEAQVLQNTAALEYQKHQLDVLLAEKDIRKANLLVAENTLKNAELMLSYTKIYAPFDGVLGTRKAYIGSYVSVGTLVNSIVSKDTVYVIANYKETQMTNIQVGQGVNIVIDSFPNDILKGTVTQIAPASGSEYALIPSDNATGNFTKVVQRIPIRIDFLPDQPQVKKLVSGMSATPKIDTTSIGNTR